MPALMVPAYARVFHDDTNGLVSGYGVCKGECKLFETIVHGGLNGLITNKDFEPIELMEGNALNADALQWIAFDRDFKVMVLATS